MAIDTAQKRYSALTFGQVYMSGTVPDGTIDQGDRQAVAFAYSGILAQTLTAATGSGKIPGIWMLLND